MQTALVRMKNVPSHTGEKVLGYASIVIRNDKSIIVREYSACIKNPQKQIEWLRKDAKQGAKTLKCEYKEMLEVTI